MLYRLKDEIRMSIIKEGDGREFACQSCGTIWRQIAGNMQVVYCPKCKQVAN